ncbi:MAG TPA: hypothetical protein VN759_03125 [Pseudolysinimonas sp.]|nr:hypothetical protein [Pseudolysinimonas sp.]
MSTLYRRRLPLTIALAAALAVASPLLLSGCSLIPHIGGGSSHGGGISVPGLSAGSGKLPSDFPKEVPVITGDIVSGLGIGDAKKQKIWNVTVKVSGATAGQEVDTQMTGAGFQGQQLAQTDEGSTNTYTKGQYSALIVVQKDSQKGWVANYTVTFDASQTAG